MAESPLAGSLGRRRLLIAAAVSCSPLARAAGICTPYELALHYGMRVDRRLRVPADAVDLYGLMAEDGLLEHEQAVRAPQYLLVVDSNPNVQAAFLFWRLVAGNYRLMGASPASTGCRAQADHFETPQGLFDCAHRAAPGRTASSSRPGLRVYDFSRRRAHGAAGVKTGVGMSLQARAADAKAQRLLGTAQSDGCILLPSTLIAFLDEFGVLDGAVTGGRPARAGHQQLPYPGRYLLVVDSERDERPQWSPAPG